VKRGIVLIFALATVLGVPAAAAALPGPTSAAPHAPEAHGLWVPVQRRCYPSRCTCRGSRAIACTRDCRRDRVCTCVRGRYVCSLYVRG
jgi:hypothetical protein